MKAPRENAGKAEIKRTKLLPDGTGTAVKPDPKPVPALFTARPFPKKAITSPEYDFGPILTPEQMAEKVPPGGRWKEMTLDALAAKALAALVGSGPKQDRPHLNTTLVLVEGLDRLRDHALNADAAAFAYFGSILRKAVADFHEIARRHPAIAAAWGETQNTLPALVGRNPAHSSDLEKAFALFQLGEASPYRVNSEKRKGGRAPNANNPTNSLAAGLCEHLNAHRPPRFLIQYSSPPIPSWVKLASTLPELSRKTAAQWADAAIELLTFSFENDAELVDYCNLGDVREEETGKGVSPQISAIKSRLRRAIRDLAAKA